MGESRPKSARIAKRTLFSARGDHTLGIWRIRGERAVSGSHRARKAPRRAQIFRCLQIIGEQYRLGGGWGSLLRTALRGQIP